MAADPAGFKMVEVLPYISRTERKIGKSGFFISEKTLTVQGNDLKECKEIFDERWQKQKKKD